MKRLIQTTLALSLAGLAACGGESKQEELAIGALLSTTGDLAAYGTAQAEAVALAAEQINAAGGVLGKSIRIVQADDGTDAAKARSAAQALIAEGVPVVIGAVGSGLTLEAAAELSAAGVVQISASSTSPLLSSFADDGYLFRTCPSDAFQGKLLAQRAKAKGFTKVAIAHVPGAYGEGLAQTFAQTFQGAGGTVSFQRPYTEGLDSYGELLKDLYDTAPEAVLLVAYPVDGAKIVKGYTVSYADRGTFWLFADGLATPDFVTGVGASAFGFQHEGALVSSPSGAQWDAFAQAYQARYGAEAQAGSYVAQAYDALFLAALAMEKAGSAEPVAIREALPRLSSGTAYGPAQYREAVAAIKAGEEVAYVGPTGPVVFDGGGDTRAAYDLWQVRDDVSRTDVTVVQRGVTPSGP